MFKRKYRIVRDNYSGYEVQHKYWFWPFWTQSSMRGRCGSNTHSSLEEAESFAQKHANMNSVVKDLGYL